jgi:hypothetical protein
MGSKGSRGWAIGLAVLGVLCLAAAAILAWAIVPGKKELPADTNTTRQFSGTAALLLNPAAVGSGNLREALLTNVPVAAQRTVKVLATDGDQAEVSDARTLTTADGQPIGQTSATYAVNRKTLEAASDPPSSWQVVDHEGLTVSFPIGTKQQDYTGWVSDTQSTTPLKYIRQESKNSLNTYVFEAKTQAQPIKDEQVLATLPPQLPAGTLAALAGSLPIPAEVKAQLGQLLPQLGDPVKLSYTYQSDTTFWVEPTTGIVVDLERKETRNVGLGLPSGGVLPAAPVYDVTTSFTDQSVTAAANEASDKKNQIQAYGTTWPLILLIVGIVAILAAVALFVMSGRGRGPAAAGGPGGAGPGGAGPGGSGPSPLPPREPPRENPPAG